MKIVKPESKVPAEWLWDYKEGERDIYVVDVLEKSWVLFGIFIVDKFTKDIDSRLQVLLDKVKNCIAVWNDYYPWSEYNGISLSREKLEDGTSFIYGQLCAENNVRKEENLVIALLANLSKKLDPQVFIRICDTDGDYTINELSDALPKEYEFPVAGNRLWLNCGKFKIIPLQDSSDSEIRPVEALEFLSDSPFKLLDVDPANDGIVSNTIKNFPSNVFSRLAKLQVSIEDEKHRRILLDNPKLISFLLKSLIEEDISVSDQEVGDKGENIDLLVSKEHLDLIPFIFEANGLSKDSSSVAEVCGRAISHAIERLLLKHTIVLQETKTPNHDVARDGSLFDLENFSVANIDLTVPLDDPIDLANDLQENLQSLFERELKISDDMADSSFYEDSSEDPDEECRKYFKDQGIDIDEDDFFEFFLKEGLKLGDSKIDELRKGSEK